MDDGREDSGGKLEVDSIYYFWALCPGWSLAWSVGAPARWGGRARTLEWAASVLTRGLLAIWAHGLTS